MRSLLLLGLLTVALPVNAKSPLSDKAWVIVRPVQCLGNPWEKEWLATNRKPANKYPRYKEFRILKNYFGRKHVAILDIRVKPYVKGDPLCQTCDCPRGDEVYLMIKASDAPTMVSLGYTERIPADQVPQKEKKKKE